MCCWCENGKTLIPSCIFWWPNSDAYILQSRPTLDLIRRCVTTLHKIIQKQKRFKFRAESGPNFSLSNSIRDRVLKLLGTCDTPYPLIFASVNLTHGVIDQSNHYVSLWLYAVRALLIFFILWYFVVLLSQFDVPVKV